MMSVVVLIVLVIVTAVFITADLQSKWKKR